MSRPRRLIITTLLTLLLLLAAGLGIVATLLGSAAGTKFLASRVQAVAGETVQWSQLEGRLLGPLRMADLRVSLPGLELAVDELHLSWQPWALLGGRAQIDALEANGILAELTPTEPGPESSPFNPEDISLPVAVTLSGLSLSDLQIIQQGQTPVQIDGIELDASIVQRQVALHRLAVRLPEGGLELTAITTLAAEMPLKLEVSWDWLLAQSTDSTDAAASVDTTAQLRGDLALEGEILWDEGIGFELQYQTRADGVQALNSDLPATINAGGELAGLQSGDKLLLHKARLTLADTGPAMALSLMGQVTDLSAAEPKAEVTVQWTGLRWPLQSETPGVTSNQGSIALAGTVSDYRLDLAAALAGQDIPAGHWRLSGNGDASQLAIDQLGAQLLGGELAISGELNWDPLPRWNLQVTGHDIDPGQLLPELPGSLALALHTRGRIDPDTGPLLDLTLQNLDGTLLDYPLQADARAEIAGDTLQLIALNLNSEGNTVSANGEVSATALDIDWQLRATNPAGFVEGFAGEIEAQGTVAGNPEAPRLQMQATGRNLAWESYALPSLAARLTAGLGTDDPLKLELTTGPVRDGEEVLLSSLRVQAAGTTAAHRLDSTLARSDEQLQLRLDGGVDRASGTWQGQLSQLSLDAADYGQWQLVGPAELSLAAEQASAGQSCLQASTGSGRVCVLGNWLAGGSSAMQGRLQDIPLALFVPGISGGINGKVVATLVANGDLRVDSTVALGSGEIETDKNRSLSHGGGNLSLQVDDAGLLATLQLAAPEQGRLQASVKLPALTALPMAAEQPLSGSISAALPDLSGLAAWVPELGTSAGRLGADLRLQGTLSQPLLEGSLALHDGALTVPMAGLELEDIELAAVSEPARAGLLAISGGIRSGPGRLVLSGAIDLDKQELDLALNGDRFQVYNTPDARALLSPQLQVGWQEQTLTLRGQVTVPEAAITPKIQLRPTGVGGDTAQDAVPGQVIAPSADVVVVSQTLEPTVGEELPEAPFRIDSRMRLTMGEDVRVKAVGFVSDITGSVDFTNAPEQEALTPIAKGRYSLKNGTFRAFGQDLEIETGHLIFADVPATEPELSLRAVRWIDNDPQVTAAGVMVTGPLTQPVLELFSRPQLEASEIQSYLLTGRSPRSRENVLGIGTYVAPKIYVGYGYNMLEKTSEFNSLFNISPRYGVGSSVGEADNNINLTITYER